MKKYLIIFLLLSLPLISAVSCSTTSVYKTAIQGEYLDNFQISCTNDLDNTTFISKTGNYYNTLEVPLLILNHSSKVFTISFNQNLSAGYYSGGQLTFSDLSTPIDVTLNITQIQQQNTTPVESSDCSIIPYPSMYRTTIQQGTKTTKKISLILSGKCKTPVKFLPEPLNFGGDNINIGGVNRPLDIQEADLVQFDSNGQASFTLLIDSEGLSQGTYNVPVEIGAQEYGESKILKGTTTFYITVTQGQQPIGNWSINNLPTCSTNGNSLSLNSSYSLTCINVDPNIRILPEIDNDYIIGLSASYPNTQYIYNFKPIKVGVTDIKAIFMYQSSPVGSPYVGNLRITPAGSASLGTSMKFACYQNDEKKDCLNLLPGQTIIRILDDLTDSIITDATVYYNGNEMSNTTVDFQPNRQYELRASYPQGGYVDKTINFTVQQRNIEYSILPNSSLTSTTILNITTTKPTDANIFIDGTKQTNPFYSYLGEGTHTIEFIAEDFVNTYVNLSVETTLRIISGYDPNTFKKSTSQLFILNKNASIWTVYYQSDQTKQKTLFISGTGDKINFTPDKVGYYSISTDGLDLGVYQIEGAKWLTWASNNLLYVIIGGVVILFLGWWLFFRKKDPSQTGMVSYT